MDISVIVQNFSTNLFMHVLKVLPEGSLSQIFYLGLSFYFMTKNG